MTKEQIKALVTLFENIVPALHREMGQEWCAQMYDHIDKLKQIESDPPQTPNDNQTETNDNG